MAKTGGKGTKIGRGGGGLKLKSDMPVPKGKSKGLRKRV